MYQAIRCRCHTHLADIPIGISDRARRNQQLSEQRASAVMNYMTDRLRIPAFRIRAVGYGDSRPVASNRTEEGRAQNRRIYLIITPKPDSLY